MKKYIFTPEELTAINELKEEVQEIINRPIGSVKIEKSYMLDDSTDEVFNSIPIPTKIFYKQRIKNRKGDTSDKKSICKI